MGHDSIVTDPALSNTQYISDSHHRQNGNGHVDWSSYPVLHLTVISLPIGVTTLDLYNNFSKYGNIVKIVIIDRRQEDWSTRAELVFEPPPKIQLWEFRKVLFRSANGFTKNVHLKSPEHKPKTYGVESPVRQGVMYDEKTQLLANSLTWGVLIEPKKMMTMKTTESEEQKVRLVLNLYKREIDIYFPFVFSSEARVATRTFRFSIALDECFTIWRLTTGVYVLHLSSVPWYSKQLKEAIAQSHSAGAKRWTEEDTWARQTDIFEHKNHFELINKSPISLRKKLNSINIARWTTLKIDLLATEDNMGSETVFRNALRDFNVNIHEGKDFQIVQADQELDHTVWSLLNEHSAIGKPLSLAEEMSRSRLSFSVRYQLEVCLSHGWLNEYQITSNFMQALASIDEKEAKQMLIYVDSYQERIWDPMTIINDLRYRRPVKQRPLPEHCIEVYSATVTATTIIWNTPTVEITNRVIRRHKHHANRFLRVKFEDDAYRGQSRLYTTSNNRMILIFERVRRVMLYGIELGDRHYEFLAWGNSQLREHGAYFFAKADNLSASDIRAEMGTFDKEKVVAKRAARMGQCFSTTKPVHLRLQAVTSKTLIPDIKQEQHGYIFTDGVGKISLLAARIIHQQLKLKGSVPSAFQFRCGGCKGVLVVWPDLNGLDVQFRESQFKFNSTSGDLEIIRCSEFWQPFLNRQVIICLSDLGVPTEIFLKKQRETIQALDAAMHDDRAAVKALRDNVDPNLMTLSLVNLIEAGFRASREPFVTSVMELWRASSLKYLKEKAKIPVPKGAFVLGCVDETNTLRGHYDSLAPHPDADIQEKSKTLPEIFIQVTDPHTTQRKVIEGLCILARNPSLHRGDIRIVKAVDIPALHHLCDVVVMPANGDRDLASMCSGGDLDGDDYMVFWDQELLPETWNAEPFHYKPPPPKMAEDEISTEDMINFFHNYLQNDFLGRIAHAHMGAADFMDDGIQSQTCLELAHLHSMAVDYPKTGVPAVMERRLERSQWPHFMEKKSRPYHSSKVLGRLYDAVKHVPFRPTHELPFDKRILNSSRPTEETLRAIHDMKHEYDSALQRIMAQHNIKTEFEVWSTFVINHSKASRDYKFHEEIGNLSAALKEQFYEALCELAGGKDFEHLAPIAVAAYQYTGALVQTALKEVDAGLRYDGEDGMPFISFPWILHETLCKVARNADNLVAEPGSVAVLQDGNLIPLDYHTEFDEQGRAQIAVRDPTDHEIGRPMKFANHLPDPYRPAPTDVEADSTSNGGSMVGHIECDKPTRSSKVEFDRDVAPAVLQMVASLQLQSNGEKCSPHPADGISSLAKNKASNNPEILSHDRINGHNSDHISTSSESRFLTNSFPISTSGGEFEERTGTSQQRNKTPKDQRGDMLPISTPDVEPGSMETSFQRPSPSDIQNGQHDLGSETKAVQMIDDPLNMTAEQLEALGLNEDMEL